MVLSPAPLAGRRRQDASGFTLSPGLWIICGLAALSSLAVAVWPVPRPGGLTFWTSARNHFSMYGPVVADWNVHHDPKFNVRLLSDNALERRLLSGFTADTPTAEVTEVGQITASHAFSGPLADVGFVDLTDLVERDHLRERFNAPSFTPWTSRGRIFGLPHDVHPWTLVYRADLVEAAGISLDEVETWEDYFRAMRPLLGRGEDGRPERFLLSIDETRGELIMSLMLQAGGGLFDKQEQPAMNSAVNAHVLATVVSWCAGPDAVAFSADETGGGNQLKLNGYVVAYLMPDWLVGLTRHDLPGLSGKLKLIPLPAWEKGGRRTTGGGGTMLGLTRAGGPVGPRWEFAKQLYASPEVARELYRTNGIITAMKTLWEDPVYDEPDPFFRGQAVGRLLTRLAPDVPPRTASPLQGIAQNKLIVIGSQLRDWAESHREFTPAGLEPEARRLLAAADADLQRLLQRNVFLREEQSAKR